jgi:hypothetical protein
MTIDRRHLLASRRLLVAVVVALSLAACGDEAPAPGPGDSASDSTSPGGSPSPTPSDSPSPTESTSPEPQLSAVFYVVDTRAGLRLAPDWIDVGSEDPGAGAVTAMIAGARDPDYTTTWNPATRVLSVTRAGKAIVVDLSAEARTANVGSEGAALMIQQLVYTASAAVDASAPVTLLIEGKPAGELWGVVSWTKPVKRADPLDVRQLVSIETPLDGATVSSPVTVSGVAATFEANVPWRVRNDKGKVVKRGFTTAAEAFTFAPYSFTVDLKPGTYTIEVSEDDPSAGEAGKPMVDTKAVVVE